MRALILILAMCLQALPAAAAQHDDRLLRQRIEAHIGFLADDLLRGRQPGTPGYRVAAAYVESHFRQLGLGPAGDRGSYLQQVPLRRAWLVQDSAGMSYEGPGEAVRFAWVDQFFMRPSKSHTRSDLTADLVFVGYGIDAPALGYSDYSGVDARGKVVVMLAGQPHDFPSEEGAHFASGRQKAAAAMASGAVGMIKVHTPRRDRRQSWDRVRNLVGAPAMGWLDADGEVFASPRQLKASATLHYEAAAVLFEQAQLSLDQVLARDDSGDALPAFALQGTIRLAQASRHETISSPNVAAVLAGSDPLLNGEFIVYTAHLDHLGELEGGGHDDPINNGALDNASGIGVMLETARLLSGGEAPRRSVLFLAVTAEEKGLVGSEYFAHHPTVPAAALAGVINLDMPLLLYDFGDVIAFGAQHSTLGAAVQQAADEAGVELTPDPFPEQNLFVRSDHYRFVQRGVPAIFLVTGMKSRDGQVDTQPIFEGFLREHYHKPSDDVRLPIDYDAAARFTRINARIGEIIANRLERPDWHEGDFFGETFGR
jgi:Zn-dependent M28 family amino/carboxypeptidase